MGGRASSLRVGLLIIGGIALLLALVWFLRGGQVNNGTAFVTYFTESVQGLEIGSKVEYRGVTVGRVTQVGVVSAIHGTDEQDVTEPLFRQVYVRYIVDTARIGRLPTVAEAVRLGLRARLNTQIITGLSYIDLDFVDPGRYPVEALPWKPEAEFVPSIPSTFAQVQNAGQQLLAKLDKVDVAQLVTSLTTLSDNLNRELASGDLHQTLTSASSLFGDADTAVKGADIPGLTANLRQTSDKLAALAASPELKALLTHGASATEQLSKLTGRMATLITALEGTVRNVSSSTQELHAGLAPLIRNMQTASENLRELTSSLRQYPAQVLSGPPPPVKGSLR
ncbi:MAG: MlaD family protein [Acetobacteraceae bacterium]